LDEPAEAPAARSGQGRRLRRRAFKAAQPKHEVADLPTHRTGIDIGCDAKVIRRFANGRETRTSGEITPAGA
jgi:hypothetical protein